MFNCPYVSPSEEKIVLFKRKMRFGSLFSENETQAILKARFYPQVCVLALFLGCNFDILKKVRIS